MRILVVDDSTTMRRIICNSLRAVGFDDIVEAGDGQQALQTMDGVTLLLTDWNMPTMDGLTLVKTLRDAPATARLPIIMITSEGARDEVMEALAAGVNDYIVKPFTKEVLGEKVKLIMQQ
ncbi:MAG: response regulator [bacterium]|jgi:two-component system chemotaxis response regulator CheY|nr:response regulator [bacterium]